MLASSALAQGDTAVAVDAARHQLDSAQTIHDEELVALAHNLLGMAAWAQGDYTAADVQHRAAREHAGKSDKPWTLALITALAGRSAHAAGDHEAGQVMLNDAEILAETVAEPMVLGVPRLPRPRRARRGPHRGRGRIGNAKPGRIPEHRLSGRTRLRQRSGGQSGRVGRRV